jgi:hypothetical protein
MTANGANQCKLFSVAVASLPAPGNGASFVASDVNC